LYKEGLSNYPKSSEAYLTLIDRFPENTHLLKTYYDLYKIYQIINDTAQEMKYKNLILNEFPDSDYAKVLLNPNYFREMGEQQNASIKLYERTYDAFLEGQYFLVINYCKMALADFPDSDLVPKFLYLKALSIGKVEVQDSLIVALQMIVVNFPKSDVFPLAESLLTYLTTEISEDGNQAAQQKSPYNYDPNESHFFAIVVNSDSVHVPALKIRLSDFDGKYFGLRKLKVNSIVLNKQRQIVTVGNFANKPDAMNYYDLLKEDAYTISNLSPKHYRIFVISSGNYPVFYKSKDTDVYMKFFEKNYLKKK
jgi:tetratricopeptide (TPR) repeat protein